MSADGGEIPAFEIPPIHREGGRFIAAFAFATLLLFWLWTPVGWIGAGLTAWCVYFFRNPRRVTPQGPGLVVSPGDGRVVAVGPAVPPSELGLGAEARTRIGIFMNVFNVHVNRVPATGVVRDIQYHPGKFLNAALYKASEDNERNAVLIATDWGADLVVVQIAGLVARRIVCELGPGQAVEAGEPLGLIRFGSRLDVYLPAAMVAEVQIGQTMVGGETILARAGSPPVKRGEGGG